MRRPVPTGIPGVDEIIGGGILPGSCVLIEGVPGAGKTTFGLQAIVNRARDGHRCLVVSFEQLPGQIVSDAVSFGWDLEELERNGTLRIVCTSPELFVEQLRSGEGPLGEELATGEIELVLIDSVSHLYEYAPEGRVGRTAVYSLISGLKRAGVTALLTKELPSADPQIVPFEEYLADVVLRLTYEMVAGRKRARFVEVLKTRGLPHVSGKHSLEITSRGLAAYPRLLPALEAEAPVEVSAEKITIGSPGLDEMLGGGVPRGFAVLVAGSAGVGKTTLALSFICAGAREGEAGLYVTFDEPGPKLAALAAGLGLDLQSYVREGLVEVLHVPPLDLNVDALLHRLGELMDELPARRLVIDSVTDVEIALPERDVFREFVYCAIEQARRRNVTTVLTTEVPELFGQATVTAQHISIIVDGIVLLKYVELESEIERSVAVLKMRGADHDKSIRQFVIGAGGIHVLGRFEGAQGVLAGAPRLIPVTLAVRSFTEFDERLNDELLQRFSQLHPNVQPVPLTLPYNPDEARMTIERALSAPETPLSAVPLCMYWMPQIIDPEKLQPVDELCPNRDEHLESMIEAATVDGRLYAVPAIAVCGVLLYRKDLLEKHGFSEPPGTWDELIEQAKTILAAEGREELCGYVFPGYMYEGLSSTFLQNLWSNGGDVIDGEGRVILDSEPAREAAQYMYDLVHRHKITPPEITGAQWGLEPQQAFWDGDVVFLTMLPTAALAMLDASSPLRDLIGIAPPPRGPRGERGVSFLGGWHYSIPRRARAPVTAAQFIQFMTSEQIQRERALRGGPLPTIKRLYDDPEILAAHPHYRILKEIVFGARSRHYIPRYLDVSRVMQRHLHSMLCGTVQPDEAIQAMADEVRKIIEGAQ